MPAVVPSVCVHCGGQSDGGTFCCSGCEAVYHALHEAGLAGWYALRQRDPDARMGQRPVVDEHRDWAYLDTDAARSEHARRRGKGFAWNLAIGGMTCLACAWLIEQVVRRFDGVADVRVDFSRRTLSLVVARDVDLAPIARELAGFGYALGVSAEDVAPARRRELADVAVAGALAANAMLMAVPAYAGLVDGFFATLFAWVGALLGTAALFGPGRSLLVGGWNLLRSRRLGLDVPIAAGLVAAWLLSASRIAGGATDGIYFDSLAMLVFTLRAGRLVRDTATDNALRAAANLAARLPERVAVWRGERFERIAPQELRAGDRVRIERGQALSFSGRLLTGADVDLAVVDGESRPRHVPAGALLDPGARAVDSALFVEVIDPTCRATDVTDPTTDAVSAVFGRRFAIVVASVAVGAGLVWAVMADLESAAAVAMSVLIVACPCGVALARPLVIARTLAVSGQVGVWVRDPGVLERLGDIDRAMLDKTGTLTAGRPRVVDERWTLRGSEKDAVIAAVVAVESAARHPLGQAIASHFASDTAVAAGVTGHQRKDLEQRCIQPVADVHELGNGIAGSWRGRTVLVTSCDGLAALDLALPFALQRFADRYAGSGETVVCIVADRPHADRLSSDASSSDVSSSDASSSDASSADASSSDASSANPSNRAVAAVLALTDSLRPGAAAAVSSLAARGITSTLLSGDHRPAVREVAASVGVPAFIASAGPLHKAREVAIAPARTLVVGDGFNDLPALRAAAASITFEDAAPAAIATADVVLAGGGLPAIDRLLDLAAASRRATTIAVAWAVTYNAVGIGLAATGHITPLLAAILMPVSSLTVGLVAVLVTGAGVQSRPIHSVDVESRGDRPSFRRGEALHLPSSLPTPPESRHSPAALSRSLISDTKP